MRCSSRTSVWSASTPPPASSTRCSIASGVDDFDFDLVVQRFGFASTPGDSLRTFFSSQAAALKGSQNLAGMSDPVIDALIERIIAAKDRPSLVNACKALDRVIRAGRYWIPTGTSPRTGSPIGTRSAGRRPNRSSRAAFPRPGGTTATRRQSSSDRARRHWHAIFAFYGPSNPGALPCESAGPEARSRAGLDHRGSKDVVRQSGHIPTKRPIGSLPAHATTQRGRGMIGFE